jgi:hypothetical protein
VKILVQDTNGVRELEEGYATELELQVFLREHADLTPLEEIELNAPPLLCIGWEVGVASGSEDILFIDPAGLITLVETKLRKNPESRREVVGQVLEYASHMASWTASEVEAIAEKFFSGPYAPTPYQNLSLRKALELFSETHEFPLSYDAFLQQLQANIERGRFRLLIAIDEPPEALIRTVEFVNKFSERFEMYLIS